MGKWGFSSDERGPLGIRDLDPALPEERGPERLDDSQERDDEGSQGDPVDGGRMADVREDAAEQDGEHERAGHIAPFAVESVAPSGGSEEDLKRTHHQRKGNEKNKVKERRTRAKMTKTLVATPACLWDASTPNAAKADRMTRKTV